MPTFIFNKLIRDKLKDEYVRMNQQAVYKKLSPDEFADALKQKIIEETKELRHDGTKEDFVSELADIQQAIHDLMDLKNISADDIEAKRRVKFDKKGGFADASYVTSLRLQNDDEWVDYYRKSPDVFKEVGDE